MIMTNIDCVPSKIEIVRKFISHIERTKGEKFNIKLETMPSHQFVIEKSPIKDENDFLKITCCGFTTYIFWDGDDLIITNDPKLKKRRMSLTNYFNSEFPLPYCNYYRDIVSDIVRAGMELLDIDTNTYYGF